jgi:hypothetical protein
MIREFGMQKKALEDDWLLSFAPGQFIVFFCTGDKLFFNQLGLYLTGHFKGFCIQAVRYYRK